MGRLIDGMTYAGGDSRFGFLEKLCAIHRLNTLAALFAARHGWLGASFSAIEILTTLYHLQVGDPNRPSAARDLVLLSKGHAAAAQYAVLAACGLFPVARLLSYKAAGGLPAHCDRTVPGVDSDSGSLGQGLSKALGIAAARRRAANPHRCWVLLGDGELQEGQVFESLLTHARMGLTNCIPIIDRNHLQSDSRCADIKDARDWNALLSGIGLRVFPCDGHSVKALDQAFRDAAGCGRPAIVLAETFKGYGTSLTSMSPDTARRKGDWHGRIPDSAEYAAMTAELVERTGEPDIVTAHGAWRRALEQAGNGATIVPEPAVRPARPTATGFTDGLLDQLGRHPMLFVLDADLEKSCKLTEVALRFPERFLEIGISEQDMTSVAAGVALGGGVGVVNTYAAFHKRALDQVFAVAAEGLPLVIAGHYAGLDYFTDGKSHQALNDIGLMRALGVIDVYEPLTPEDAGNLLAMLLDRFAADRAAGRRSVPAYVRLHRTPLAAPLPPAAREAALRWRLWPFEGRNGGSDHGCVRIFGSDPHLVSRALATASATAAEREERVEVVGFIDYADPDGELQRLARGAKRVVMLESHLAAGGPAEWLAARAGVPVVRFGPEHLTGSTRTFDEMLAAQRMDAFSL